MSPLDPDEVLAGVPRTRLATLPTPLERGPELPGGARLWVKRDDLTGLGAGGNKVRKLEFLCGDAVAAGARALVTVGAAQSNHCRTTAAAGAVLGLEVHLVMSGDRPDRFEGNQLLDVLFGAQLHYAGCPESHWGELEIAREELTAGLAAEGLSPHSIPMGGSTPTGALGYLAGSLELAGQCRAAGIEPAAIVHTSSSGGTHAGLLAGRALLRSRDEFAAPVLAIGVAEGVLAGRPDVTELATAALGQLASRVDPGASTPGPGREPPRAWPVPVVGGDDVEVDGRWLGDGYAEPTRAGDDAVRWAAAPRRLGARPHLHRQGLLRPARRRGGGTLGSGRRRRLHPHGRPARRLHDRRRPTTGVA